MAHQISGTVAHNWDSRTGAHKGEWRLELRSGPGKLELTQGGKCGPYRNGLVQPIRSASPGQCFGPVVVPPVHNESFLHTGGQAVRLC